MACWTDDWVVAWLVVWLVGLMDGWMDERMIGCMNGSNCHYLWHKHPMYDWKQNVFQSQIITLRNNRGNNETKRIGSDWRIGTDCWLCLALSDICSLTLEVDLELHSNLIEKNVQLLRRRQEGHEADVR